MSLELIPVGRASYDRLADLIATFEIHSARWFFVDITSSSVALLSVAIASWSEGILHGVTTTALGWYVEDHRAVGLLLLGLQGSDDLTRG